MEKDFDFKQVPYNWPLCYLSECGRKEECLRYQVTSCVPRQVTNYPCVLPTALEQGQCHYFHAIQRVKAAAGFRNIVAELKEKDLYPIRVEMTAYLGCKSTYYNYRNGKKLLTPKQQEHIKKILQRHGYTDEIRFDGYRDIYLFK